MKTKIFFFTLLFISFLFSANLAKAQPAAINDLYCVFSQLKGAVWLSWTPPAGTNSYDVRYSVSPITAANFYNAWQFAQNWPGAANQGIVNNLTENYTYYFAMRAIDIGNLASPISNLAYCFVPEVTVQRDTTPPNSSIIDPKDGAEISAGKNYTVLGTSSDIGGSSVQKVEISLDGGSNWRTVNPTKKNDNGFEWNFLWQNPSVGEYNLKTRATDWVDNIETPAVGIKVSVIPPSPSPTPMPAPTPTPTPEKPISEMTIEELKTKITEIQEKIIELLTQLIQVYQAKIIELTR
jgi:hypothetical protein